ncbi:MAG TPA: DUF3592 domain-containing protein [Reyranella sp.]|nr:DUF3592 domain-containing protein [Reyranella sp.]
MDKSWRWISWLILGIGGLIVAGGLALGYGSLRLVLYGERAPGVVSEIAREGDMYAPVFRFRLPTTGEVREVKALGSGAPSFAVGDPVTVIYASDPDDFAVDDFDELWLSPIMVTGFGCFWLMFGAVAWGLSRGADLAVLGERAFLAIAVGAAILGVVAAWNASELYRTGLRAEGTVTEIRASRYTDQEEVVLASGREYRRDVERTSYAPVVRFTTAEGREIEFLGRGGSGTSYSEGDVVTVAYDPGRPIHAHIVSFVDLWLPTVVAWGIAILFGGCVWLSRRFRLRP